MPVPALNRVTVQRPSAEHGTTAAANAPFLEVGDTTVPATLKALGFKDLGSNRFEHADSSWVQYNASRRTWERGVGNVLFRGLPKKFDEWPSARYSAAQHGSLAVAYLPKISPTNLATASAALQKAGFVQTLPSYFAHPDGSFVALTGGKVTGGVRGTRLTHLPAAGRKQPTSTAPAARPSAASARAPAAQARPRAAPRHEVFKTLPFVNDWPKWRQNFAVAKLPRADGGSGRSYTPEQLSKILKHVGFTEASPNQWSHPDGSQVTTSSGRVVGSRFQQWGFGQFPYRRGTHWPQWNTDTQAWTRWVTQGGTPPFPKYSG